MSDSESPASNDSQAMFERVFAELSAQNSQLKFPKQILWLGGAPGAGKGTQISFIMEKMGISSQPIGIASLLTSPEAEALKAQGILVSDDVVLGLLFAELIKPQYAAGVIVDGFPRTQPQADVLRMLDAKIKEIGGSTKFTMLTLLVNEEVSVARQLHRGEEAQKAKTIAPMSLTEEIRPTDLDPALAAKRYNIFKDSTFSALESLKDVFESHVIDSSGSIEEVRKLIDSDLA